MLIRMQYFVKILIYLQTFIINHPLKLAHIVLQLFYFTMVHN